MMLLPEEERNYKSLVVSNSWAIFQEAMDFPPGHPVRYVDNLRHPFIRVVTNLAGAGADIVFAAGNCGPDCPDPRRTNTTANTIYGANGLPDVLCVGAVDVNDELAGYSSHGPGLFGADKPDLAAYTHFRGSESFARGSPDTGSSTSCPIAAGVIAAIRSRFPFERGNTNRSPTNLRKVLTDRAIKVGGRSAWDHQYGHGVLNAEPLSAAEATRLS